MQPHLEPPARADVLGVVDQDVGLRPDPALEGVRGGTESHRLPRILRIEQDIVEVEFHHPRPVRLDHHLHRRVTGPVGAGDDVDAGLHGAEQGLGCSWPRRRDDQQQPQRRDQHAEVARTRGVLATR